MLAESASPTVVTVVVVVAASPLELVVFEGEVLRWEEKSWLLVPGAGVVARGGVSTAPAAGKDGDEDEAWIVVVWFEGGSAGRALDV